jgi:hypothetical protein
MKRENRDWVQILGLPDPDEYIDKDAAGLCPPIEESKKVCKERSDRLTQG